MELQRFEVQVCTKAETRDLEMAFSVKSHWSAFQLFLNCFTANQMGFEQFFDKLTFKHIDALKKQIQYLVDYILKHS